MLKLKLKKIIRVLRRKIRRKAKYFSLSTRYKVDLLLVSIQAKVRSKQTWITRLATLISLAILITLFYFYALREMDYESKSGDIKSLFQQISSGLIGAAVVCISLITFFLQNNLGRLPFSLFNRLSSDPLTLSYFVISFAASITTGLLSIFYKEQYAAEFILLFVSLCAIVVSLLIFSFFRALDLVNPSYQLLKLYSYEKWQLIWWTRRFEIARPLMKKIPRNRLTTFDYAKRTFFDLNSHWTNSLTGALRHCAAFARSYSESGDYAVSKSAFQYMISLNKAYIDAKQNTFIAYSAFFDRGNSSDVVVQETLEQIRQLHASALSKRDEQLLEQCQDAYLGFTELYHTIDYGVPHAEKTHSNLALGYFRSDLEKIVPQKFPDVMLHGVRLLSLAGMRAAHLGEYLPLENITETLGKIAPVGLVSREYQPVTASAVKSLGLILQATFTTKSRNLVHSQKNIFARANLPLTIYLNSKLKETNDTALPRPATLFALVDADGFYERFSSLVQQIIDLDAVTDDSKEILARIENWAENIAIPVRELLKVAVAKQSFSAYDLVQWISAISRLLIGLSSAAATPDYLKPKFERHALWLVSGYSSIEDRKEDVFLVESFQLTEAMFEVAIAFLYYRPTEALNKIISLLLWWGATAAKYGGSYATLDEIVLGVAALVSNAEQRGVSIDFDRILQTQVRLVAAIPAYEIDGALKKIQDYESGELDLRHITSQIDEEISKANLVVMKRYLNAMRTIWFQRPPASI